MPNQAYRLRIRNAADSADALVLTSIAGGTNPYIASPPSGDGQEVDLLTGAVRTGAYVVEVVDVATGSDATGTIRVLTNQLNDSSATTARPHLLSRRAYVEMSTDGGSTWTTWCAGYLSNVRQIDAIRYAVTVSNTRRVEQTKQVFTWQTAAERTAFPKRGCIFGGPIIGGLGGGTTRTIDSGGWTYQYKATTGTSSPVAGDTLALSYVSGAFYPLFEQKKVPGPTQSAQWWRSVKPYLKRVSGDASASGSAFTYLQKSEVFAMPDLTAIVTDPATGNQWLGEVRAIDLGPQMAVDAEIRLGSVDQNLYVKLYTPDTSWPTLPSANTALRVRVITRQVAEASPVYIQAHPADVAKKLYELINVPVNATAYNAIVDALGTNLRVTYRITAAQTMADFLEQSVFGPFGFAARINGSGEVEFFSTRVLNYVAPTYTIGTNDIVGDEPPTIYDLDEATVVTGFTLTQSVLTAMTNFNSDDTDPAPDGMVATEQTLEYVSGDTSTYSTRVVSYTVPGMVTDADSFVPTFTDWSRGVVFEGFNRFGRGAVNSEVAVLRTSSAAAAQVGDFVYLDASYYPNRNYRIGESSVGSRVAQVVRREERPEAVVFKLVDAGGFVQPATAATVSLAVSTADPRRVAQFTITNAATLNSGSIGVAVEWATGASAPAAGKNGNLFTRYAPGSVPTGAVQLPAVKLGATTVHVRVRSEVPGIFPSAWSGWQTVTLNAWTAPTSVTVGTLTNETAAVSWSLNTNTTDAVDVYVAPGSVAPSDWTPYRVNTLPEGTTSTLLTGLTASTAYIVGVAFRDRVANIAQTPVTATFTTAGTTTGTADVPAGLVIVDGVNDVNVPQGVVLGLYASVGASSIVVERAPNLTSGVTDYPGTYAEIAVLPATAQTYVDYLPKDGTKYWYRIKHRTPGKADSNPVPQRLFVAVGNTVYAGLQAVATGVPASVTRPAVVPAIITPTSLYNEAGPFLKQLLVQLQYTDAQSRVVYYEYRSRERIKKTWGSWTAWSGAVYPSTNLAYMQADVTLNNTSYIYEVEWRVYGADGEGNLSYIRSGVTEWPQNYGQNKPIIKIQKQGYNSGTSKYEVWWRYYFDRGNSTLDEDGDDNTQQTFTTQVIAASVKDQTGSTATNVVTSGTKTADGWKATWDSTAGQSWVFEVSVNTTLPTSYYLQYQDTDVIDEQFVAPTSGQTFSAPAASATATTGTLTLGTYLTGGTYNGSSNVTTTVDATSTNTASKVVARDASGNFAAGTITAALSGNATTATTLQTARNINGVSFNGSADITVTAAAGTLTGSTLASNVTASSLTSVGTLTNLTVTNPISGSVTGSAGSVSGIVGIANGGTNASSYGTTGTGTRAIVYDTVTNAFEAVSAGTSGQFLQSAGSSGDILWATPPNFSTASTTAGYVPGSNGVGTSYFLRADGTWAVPSAGSVSANNVTAGTFSGANYYFTNNVRFDSGARVAYGYGYTIDNVSGTPVSVLTATTLGSGVTASSLTSVGSLLGLTIASGYNASLTAGDLSIASNAGYGILSADATRAIAVTNAGTTINDGLTVATAGSSNTLVTNSAGYVGIGVVPTSYRLEVNGTVYSSSGGFRFPDGTTQTTAFAGSVNANSLTGTTLASNVTASSLTSVGTLSSLAVSGDLTVDTSTLKVDSANNRVGIGTASPSVPLEVLSGTANTVAGAPIAVVVGANAAITSEGSIFSVQSNTAMAADVGGSINLGGRSTTSSAIAGAYAHIAGRKENGTSGNFAGYLQFGTSDSASDVTEKMRLDSSGRLGIGTTSPNDRLEVQDGNVRVYHNSALNLAGYGVEFSTNGGGTDTTIAGIYSEQNGTSVRTGSLLFSTSNAGAPSTKMRLDASGNLGIGTTSPNGTLDVGKGQATPSIKLGNSAYGNNYESVWGLQSGAQSILIFGNNGQNEIRAGNTVTGGYLDIITNNTAAFTSAHNGNHSVRFAANGYVGIGTTSPSERLHISGNVRIADTYSLLMGTGAEQKIFAAGSANNTYLTFNQWTGAAYTERARIDSSGNLCIGTTGSGFKVDVVGAGNASSALRILDTSTNGSLVLQAGSGSNMKITGYNYSSGVGVPLYISVDGANTILQSGGGNVGIGTTSPGNPLVVASNTASQVSIEAVSGNNNSQLNFNPAGTGIAYIKNQQATALAFGTNNTERARIDATGNVGIGTTSPTSLLNVNGSAVSGTTSASGAAVITVGALNNYPSLELAIGSTYNAQVRTYGNDLQLFAGHWRTIGNVSSEDHSMFFYTSRAGSADWSTPKMMLNHNGNVGIGTSSPSAKLHLEHLDNDGIRFTYTGNAYPHSITNYFSSAASSNSMYFNVYNGSTDATIMTVVGNGSVGIGQTSPGATIDVWKSYSNGSKVARFVNNGSAPSHVAYDTVQIVQDDVPTIRISEYNPGSSIHQEMTIGVGDGYGNINCSVPMRFWGGSSVGSVNYNGGGGTLALTVSTGGNVLVGALTGWASGRLQVGTTSTSAPAAEFNTTGSTSGLAPVYIWNNAESGDPYFIQFYDRGNTLARRNLGYIRYKVLSATLDLVTASDYRVKRVLGPYEKSGAVFDKIAVHEGHIYDSPMATPFVLAHELAEAVPYAVDGEKDAVNEDGTPKVQMVSYGSLIPLMLAEIKSLRARVAALES